MVTTTLAPDRPRSHAAIGDLVFRIAGSSRDGQLVRIRATKCTIGAGRRCTLRLLAEGVAPVHCLVVRGPNGMVVRRWSPDTRLNEREFTDARLSVGDRLSIGPIELDVVADGVAMAGEEQPTARNEAAEDKARQTWLVEQKTLREEWANQRQQLAEWQSQLETQQTAVENDRNALRADRNAVNAEREALTAERATFDEQRTSWQAEQEAASHDWERRHQEFAERQVAFDTQQATLDANQARLKTECDALTSDQAAFERQRGTWQAEQEAARPGLDDARRELAEGQAKLDGERTAVENDRNALQADRNAVNAEREALTAERATFDERRTSWQVEQEAASHDWERRHQELTEWRAELDQEKTALQADRDAVEEQRKSLANQQWEWEQQRQAEPSAPASEATAAKTVEGPVEEPRFETPASESPVDLTSVLRRYGVDVELAEEETTPTTASPQMETPTAAPRAAADLPAKPAEPAAPSEDEESIDDYMRRLMKRVRTMGGESTDSAAPASQLEASSSTPAEVARDVEQPVARAASLPAEPRAAERTAPVRREAPEKRIDLSALREVANLSAENALSRHDRHVLVNTMYSKLAVAAVAIVAGVILFWMWFQAGAFAMTLYAAGIAVFVGLYWGFEYAWLTGRLVRHKSGRRESPQPTPDNASTSPTEESTPVESGTSADAADNAD